MMSRKIKFETVVRIVLLFCLLIQAVVVPLVEAESLFVQRSADTLKRQPAESLDDYIERIAEAEPDLLQEATMAAVQDAFNGHFGENPAEDALEQRVLFHLNQVIDPLANYQYRSWLDEANADEHDMMGEGWSASTVRPPDFDESFPPLPDGVTVDESAGITYPETTFSAPPEPKNLSRSLVYNPVPPSIPVIPEPDSERAPRPAVERVPDFVQHAPSSLPTYSFDQLDEVSERVVRIDDIPFDKSRNDIQSQNSSMKITNITGTQVEIPVLFIEVRRKRPNTLTIWELQGTLEIKMPSNDVKIPISFQRNSSGNLSGVVRRVEVNVAGGTVILNNAILSNAGLRSPQATMKSSSKISSFYGRQTETPIAEVTITADGLTIDDTANNSRFRIPDFSIGRVIRFDKMSGRLVTSSSGAESVFTLDIAGNMTINLYGKSQEIAVTGIFDTAGNLQIGLSQLEIGLSKADLTLKLTGVQIGNTGVAAAQGELILPVVLSGRTIDVRNVRINRNGVQMDEIGINVGTIPIGNTPISLHNVTVSIGRKGGQNLFAFSNSSAPFEIILRGSMTISGLPKSGGVSAIGEFRLPFDGDIQGTVSGLDITIAGLTLGIENAKYHKGVLTASRAYLALPTVWGGGSVSVDSIRIDRNGLKIGGGSFTLPEIRFGGVTIALSGKVVKQGRTYIIQATGVFTMPGTGRAVGCGGIEISATLSVTTLNQQRSVELKIEPLVPESTPEAVPDDLSLDELRVHARDCFIPIGSSGMGIVDVVGEMTIQPGDLVKISLTVRIGTRLKLANVEALAASGSASYTWQRNPRKNEISLNGTIEVFSMFEVARSEATLDLHRGQFDTTLNINAVVYQGTMRIRAWGNNNQFYLAGSSDMQFGFRKGQFGKWGFFPLPPFNISVNGRMEIGRFANNAWGAKTKVDLILMKAGLYFDTKGNISLRNVDRYRLATPPRIKLAYQLQQQLQQRTKTRLELTAEQRELVDTTHFTPNQTTVDFTVPYRTGTTILFLHPTGRTVDLSIIMPDGLIITEQNAPDAVTFRHDMITLDEFPDEEKRLTSVLIREADAGGYQFSYGLDVSDEDLFDLNIIGEDLGVQVEELVVRQAAGNSATLDYTFMTSEITTTMAVYAAPADLEDTVIYSYTDVITNTNGVTETVTLTDTSAIPGVGSYVLTEVEIMRSAANRRSAQKFAQVREQDSITVDLSALPSGDYDLWIAADDGENIPITEYASDGMSGNGRVTVNHIWEETFTADVKIDVDPRGLTVDWEPSDNPDVDVYSVYASLTEVTPKTTDVIVDTGEETSAELTGLLPNQPYYITIVGRNIETGQTMNSNTVLTRTENAPFTITAEPSDITIRAGGDPVTVTLNISTTVDPYPGAITLYGDDSYLLNFTDYTFGSEVVSPTITGTQTTMVIQIPEESISETGTFTIEAYALGWYDETVLDVTVESPAFTLESDRDTIEISEGETVTVPIAITSQFGETDEVYFALDAPDGVVAQLSADSAPMDSIVTLTITDTSAITSGIYTNTNSGTFTLVAADGDKFDEITFDLAVNKPDFYLEPILDYSVVQQNEPNAERLYQFYVDGIDWTEPITLSFPDSTIANGGSEIVVMPDTVVSHTVSFSDTAAAGLYQLPVIATSNGVSKTLPLLMLIDDTMGYELEVWYEDVPFDVVAGDMYSYTLAVTNHGVGTPEYVVIAEEVPENVTHVDLDGCLLSITMLWCYVGRVEPGAYITRTITWKAAPDTSDLSELLHEAVIETDVAFDGVDSSAHNNEAQMSVTAYREADLAVTLTSGATTAGDEVMYTATVVNNGVSTADNTLLSLYAYDAELVTASAVCLPDDYDDVVCGLGSLAPGAQAQVTMTSLVPADQLWFTDYAETEAFATSDAYDPSDLWDELAFVTSTIQADVDLSIAVTRSAETAAEGEMVDYTVTVVNDGLSYANDVVLTNMLPDNLILGDVGNVTWQWFTETVGYDFYDLYTPIDLVFLAPQEVATVKLPMFLVDDADNNTQTQNDFVISMAEASIQTITTTLTVNNLPPTIDIINVSGGNEIVIPEGISRTLQASIGDVLADDVTVAWDFDDDGLFDDADGAIVVFDATEINGTTVRPIAVKATDDDGAETVVTATIRVENDVPAVLVGTDQYAQLDEPINLSAHFVDLGAGGETYTATVDWGDNTVETVPIMNGQLSSSHTYSTTGEYDVTACVTDSDSAEGCGVFTAVSTCLEHGLTAHIINDIAPVDDNRNDARIQFAVTNGSGVREISAGLQLTLYANDVPLEIVTAAELAVGKTETFIYDWLGADAGDYALMVRVNDAAGTPSNQMLCGVDESIGVSGMSKIVDEAAVTLPLPEVEPTSLTMQKIGVSVAGLWLLWAGVAVLVGMSVRLRFKVCANLNRLYEIFKNEYYLR